MAYTVMDYIVMAYIAMACSYGLYSYGLYSYGLYSYGLYSYGRNSTRDTSFHAIMIVRRHIPIPTEMLMPQSMNVGKYLAFMSSAGKSKSAREVMATVIAGMYVVQPISIDFREKLSDGKLCGEANAADSRLTQPIWTETRSCSTPRNPQNDSRDASAISCVMPHIYDATYLRKLTIHRMHTQTDMIACMHV